MEGNEIELSATVCIDTGAVKISTTLLSKQLARLIGVFTAHEDRLVRNDIMESLMLSVEDLELPVRIRAHLKTLNIEGIRELVQRTRGQLQERIREDDINLIEQRLENLSLYLGMDLNNLFYDEHRKFKLISKEKKAEHCRLFYSMSLSQSEYCKRNNISLSTFNGWLAAWDKVTDTWRSG